MKIYKKETMNNKIKLGQFFTVKNNWLKPQIKNFILKSKKQILCDPFAGNGDIFKAIDFKTFEKTIGYDIDINLNWKINDSLIHIPKNNDSIIITNPPYIKKYSAKRQKIDLEQYFNLTKYDDIYLLALDKCLESTNEVIALIPESFIHSNYEKMNLLSSITILEDNPFLDTEMPVCVACFDGKWKKFNEIKIYKNNLFIDNLENIFNWKIKPNNKLKIKFNDRNGWLGLRGIDGIVLNKKIKFDFKENLPYNWIDNIKESSRHFSLINIEAEVKDKQKFINLLNGFLNDLRNKSNDIILTAFKGNMKDGTRRRRLDFKLARALIEKTFSILQKENIK